MVERGTSSNALPEIELVRVPSRWVTSWVTTDAAETGRPRTMVDRSGSSAQLFAQLIDAWSLLHTEEITV